jgi:hypothetical protein
LNLARKFSHVAICSRSIFPAHVYHGEWTNRTAVRKRGDQVCVAKDLFSSVPAVSVVPVVGAVHRGHRQRRARAGLSAKIAKRIEGFFPGRAFACHDGGAVKVAIAKHHAIPTILYIQPERNSLLVDLPEAECARCGPDSVGMAGYPAVLTIRCGEVPRQHTLRNDVLPAQVTIAPLPGVAKHQQMTGHGTPPAKMQVRNGSHRRSKQDGKSVGFISTMFRCDFNLGGALPSGAGPFQRNWMRQSCKCGHLVRWPQQV